MNKNRTYSEDYISDDELEEMNKITLSCYNHKNKIMEYHSFPEDEFLKHAHTFDSKHLITCPNCNQNVEDQYIRNGPWTMRIGEKIIERCTYVNGKLDGLYERFYLNGIHYEKSYYKNGILDGLCEFWYDISGKKMKQMNFVNGKVHGIYKYWTQDGDLKENFVFNNGIREDIIVKIPSVQEKLGINVLEDVSVSIKRDNENDENIFDLSKKKKKDKREKREEEEREG
jgi:antitoxin component YwqK of YwqJK toxin-antitoxin module